MNNINKQNIIKAVELGLISWFDFFALMSKELDKMNEPNKTNENGQDQTIFPTYAKILNDFKKLNQTKRHALCCYGCEKSWTESSESLPFFKNEPNKQWDNYYCGCYGWG